MEEHFKTLSATLLFSLAAAAPAVADSITFVTFAGYYPPQLFEEFEKATGHTVDLVEVAANEETMGKMMASNGAGFDLLVMSSPYITALNQLGMLAEIDHSKIPNLSNLYDEAMNLPYDPGLKLSVPWAWGSFGLCYRTDLLSTPPSSWADVIHASDELKGKYTIVADERWFLEPAQLLAGKSVNDVSEATLEKIRPLLVEMKKNALTFDSFTMGARLISGEALVSVTWENWCNLAKHEGGAVDYVIPKEGSDTWVDSFVIPAASEKKDVVYEFINFILRPEVHSWLVTELIYKVPNRAAMEMVDPAHFEKYPAYKVTMEDLAKFEMLDDLGAEAPRVSRFITEVMAE